MSSAKRRHANKSPETREDRQDREEKTPNLHKKRKKHPCNTSIRAFKLYLHFLVQRVRPAFTWASWGCIPDRTEYWEILEAAPKNIGWTTARASDGLLVYRFDAVSRDQVHRFRQDGFENVELVGQLCGYLTPFPDKLAKIGQNFMTWLQWSISWSRQATKKQIADNCPCNFYMWTECVPSDATSFSKIHQRLHELNEAAYQLGYDLRLQTGIYKQPSEHCDCEQCIPLPSAGTRSLM